MPSSKNHFYFSYMGNKRSETSEIFKSLPDMSNIKCIIEPFAGSSAFSYALSLIYPGRFKYVINDNCTPLIELYKLCKDQEKLQAFELKINNIAKTLTKEIYNLLPKGSLEQYYIHNKIHTIRSGLYKLNYKYKELKIRDSPIYNFLNTENIEFTNTDGLVCYNQYKNDPESLIFLDPPYLMACNDFYSNSEVNIYPYLWDNKIKNEKANIMVCLEWSWIIQLLFKDNKYNLYNKMYQTSKKNTTHAIISNR